MHATNQAHKGSGKLDYQNGHRKPGSKHVVKEATLVYGSMDASYRFTDFLEFLGYEKHFDEISLGCSSIQAAKDFTDLNSELWITLQVLLGRGRSCGHFFRHISAIQHTLESGGLDGHINALRYDFLRNKVSSLFSTTPSDEMLQRYLASAISQALGYPDPEDPKNYRLKEHFDVDEDPKLLVFAKAADDLVCAKVLNGEVGSFPELKSLFRKTWKINPQEIKTKNGWVRGLSFDAPFTGIRTKLTGRKYAGPEGFDQILGKLEINPQNRELRKPKRYSLQDMEKHFQFREESYWGDFSQPPHSRFGQKINKDRWQDVLSTLETLSLDKFQSNRPETDNLSPGSINTNTLIESIEYGKQKYHQESHLPKMLIGRRAELQAAYEHFKQQQRRLELLANFARNTEPAGNIVGESGFNRPVPDLNAHSPRALAFRSRRPERPVEFPQPEQLINSDDNNSVEMAI